MFQESEIVCLVLGIALVCPLLYTTRQRKLPHLAWMYAGIALILCAHVFTVVEGVLWNSLFNTLEHACYMSAGLAFVVGLLRLSRTSTAEP